MANKIVFASNINIGQNGAENDDEFLFKCFVDHPALAELRDLKNSVSFVLGSTGIGKTAVLRMIEKQEKNCQSIELQDMAMNHISNSDTIQFLKGLDVDLNIFFQALWKHVICIEYIKMIGLTENEDKLKYYFGKIRDAVVGNKQKAIVEKFQRDNSNSFWNTIDINIVEYTDVLTKNVSGELGAEIEKYNARAGYARSLSAEKRT